MSAIRTDEKPLSVGDKVGRVAGVLIAVESEVDAGQIVLLSL